MSAKLGIAIGPDAVRGVLLRAGAITFHQWIALQDDSSQSIGQALRMLLRRLPRRRFSRYRVVVAISSHHSQLRLLEELPPLGDARVLARVVEEDVSRFFLRNGTPILPGGVRMIGADQAWACAFDRPIVLDVVQACRDA